MEFLLIQNAYKAPVKRVFDYIGAAEYRNPSLKQRAMLLSICDGFILFEAASVAEAKTKMRKEDYLYRVVGDDVNLVAVGGGP